MHSAGGSNTMHGAGGSNTMHGAGGNNAMVQGDIKADTGANVNLGIQVLGTEEYQVGMDGKLILGKKGKEFSNAPLAKVEPQIVEINSLTDSEHRLQKILALIEDVKIRKIGIWGMGGIGKTRTLKLLNNRLEESHMFDIVIWVTVSREGSRRKVQHDIAERLKCTGEDKSVDRVRASISKILSGKRFLLILDDIWERIDLSDVGIPILNQDNGCKVLLTTRDYGICQKMETDEEIQIQRLSEEEAWSLFNEKVGDVSMFPRIYPIARDIVKKCGGFPLTIILIGSSLRNDYSVHRWKNTLRKLKLPCTSQIEGIENDVFSSLRIVYDRLPEDSEKKLFLYCALYPEDHKILITELVEYCWLEGYIQGVDSIEEARDEGHDMVMSLVDASLLERAEDSERCVKMHDIIRDFALNEASGILVRTGEHVKHPPEEKEWLLSQKISLMQCSLGCLPERPNCGSLSTLLLQGMDGKLILGKKGKEFSNAPLAKVEPQIVEINSLTDSEPRLQKILALIEDVKIRKIGIWGMGGIGKTRTLKLLNNRLEESHMFEIVIWVTVSREGSRRKVQHDIAERLKCTAIDMSDDRLKVNIYHHLRVKKFLLILDDIWEKIDLSDVGIPILNQDNGCKVLLTTRDYGICQKMETDEEIQIQRLSEEVAWSLFNEKVGDVAMSPRIEPIARDIVKKCGGLPLAIIVIGSSLSKISYVGVWRSTLKKLQLPSTSQIKGMEKEVFSSLRISYDRLSENSERNLFLYCSLYPEDYIILIDELAEYCRLEGYIEGVDSIEEARDDGFHKVMNLVDASLLERADDSEECVKMHDIIRDFALNEASGFLVKTGKHVKHPPEEKEWLLSQKISLMHCSLGCLPERPNCGSLSTLLLQGNDQLTMISDPFFERMHSLCILDLSWAEIKSLPSSLWNVVNLRGLYLKGCLKLKELPFQVGALTQLEVLDLGYSTIKYLPKEVGELTRLKRLIVGFKKRERPQNSEDVCSQDDDGEDTKEWNMKLRVPAGIILKLPYLEELSLCVYDSIHVCVEKEQWDDESMEVVVEELCRLEHLTYLDAYFPKVECLKHFLRHSKSVKNLADRRFRFRVGTQIRDVSSGFLPCPPQERCLVYNGGVGSSHAAIMETLAHSSSFHLDDHRTARKLSELGLANMNKLKECIVQDCEKMETLFYGDEQQEACVVLANLETLQIWDLPELRSLCDGPLLPGSLSKLTKLELHDCNNLKKVFQLSIIRLLCSLEILWVSNCSTIEEIIEIEEEEMSMSVASHTHNVISYNNDRLILPNIKDIYLSNLPELVSICRGFSNFEWPSLETIDIFECPKLESLSFLSNGTNIVAPALKKIEGESSWWEALEWENNDIKQRLQPLFFGSRW